MTFLHCLVRISSRFLAVLATVYLTFINTAYAQNLADFSLGGSNICAIDADGNLECTTIRDESLHLPSNDGTLYRAVSSGLSHTCAITQNGEMRCFGRNDVGQLDAPQIDVEFISLSASGNHTCAIDANTQAHCWGLNTNGQTDIPEPTDGFALIRTSSGASCGVRVTGDVECWTTNTNISANIPDSPGYTDLVVGQGGFLGPQSCGLTTDGAIDCWTNNSTDASVPSGGPYIQIESNGLFLCGLTSEGELDCNFGNFMFSSDLVNERNQALLNEIDALPPISSFAIQTQSSIITSMCGITFEGSLVCIGESLPANQLPGATDAPLTVPMAVENLSFVAYSDTTIELFWDRGNPRVSGSNIYRDNEFLTFTNNSSSFIDDTLVAGQEYVYTVSFVDTTGFEGPLSTQLFVSTGDRGPSGGDDEITASLEHSGQPVNINLIRYGDTSLEIFWDRPSAFPNAVYQIFRNNEFLAIAPGPSYFDSDVGLGVDYFYTIVVAERIGSEVVGVGFARALAE